MSNRFKFRAWLKDSETMLYSDKDCDNELMEVWLLGDDGLKIQIQETVWREGGGETYEETRYVDADAVIMQFSGLHDSKGVEIYESDLLKTYYKGEWVILQVVWNPLGMWSIKWKDGYLNNYTINASKTEIIGNVHQHPELLKD